MFESFSNVLRTETAQDDYWGEHLGWATATEPQPAIQEPVTEDTISEHSRIMDPQSLRVIKMLLFFFGQGQDNSED